jgi:hypothetical protein
MRLTWRDAGTALLALAVGLVYVANVAGWATPIVSDTRGATLLLGIAGFSMCILGGSSATISRKSTFMVPASMLGGAAVVLIIAGLITGWSWIVPWLTADIVLLWAISTVRHAIPAPQTTQQA